MRSTGPRTPRSAAAASGDFPHDLPLAILQQAARTALSRNRDLRGELQERLEHEGTLVHARVGDGQARRAQLQLLEKQQIEVEAARGIGKGTLPAVARFDDEQLVEQFFRFERGLQGAYRIDE